MLAMAADTAFCCERFAKSVAYRPQALCKTSRNRLSDGDKARPRA